MVGPCRVDSRVSLVVVNHAPFNLGDDSLRMRGLDSPRGSLVVVSAEGSVLVVDEKLVELFPVVLSRLNAMVGLIRHEHLPQLLHLLLPAQPLVVTAHEIASLAAFYGLSSQQAFLKQVAHIVQSHLILQKSSLLLVEHFVREFELVCLGRHEKHGRAKCYNFVDHNLSLYY